MTAPNFLCFFRSCLTALAGLTIGLGGCDEKKEEEKPTPTASVSVAPILRTEISEQLVVYGSVTVPPGAVQIVSVPFECRVVKIAVAPGTTVSGGEEIIEVQPSAATALALEEVRSAVAASQRDYDLIKKRYDQNLATNTDLNTADSALKLARGRLANLEQSGVAGQGKLKSPSPGIISKIDVQPGQIVPAGGPLIEIAAENKVEVRLGVDPAKAGLLKRDQRVIIRRIDDDGQKEIEGKIRLVGQRVDTTSRLVDVMVSLTGEAKLLLDSPVSGTIAVKTVADALVVPRSAVLPGDKEGEYEIFTIKEEKAVKHTVHVGIQTDDQSQIIADDLKEGDLVVTVGNLELEEGMKAQVAAPATQPAKGDGLQTKPTIETSEMPDCHPEVLRRILPHRARNVDPSEYLRMTVVRHPRMFQHSTIHSSFCILHSAFLPGGPS